MEAFGRVLRQILVILADNAGYDLSDRITRLKATLVRETDAGFGMSIFSDLSVPLGRVANCVFEVVGILKKTYVSKGAGCDGEQKKKSRGTGTDGEIVV